MKKALTERSDKACCTGSRPSPSAAHTATVDTKRGPDMKLIVTFAFYFLYWFICFLCTGTDRKNLAGLRSYPDAVQKAVREHPVLGKAAPQEKSIIAILLGNLFLFTVVFSVLGLALKNILDLNSFGTAFWFFLKGWEGLILSSLTCCGGEIPSVSASPSCRSDPTIKTLPSTSALSCGVSRCLHWWQYCRH